MLAMLSRSLTTISELDIEALAILLTEICCGRSPELWDTWRQGHGLSADTVFLPGLLIDDIASMVMLQRSRGWGTYQVFDTMFRTGDIDAGNRILSLFITQSPSFAASIRSFFSWDQVSIFPPVKFLGKNSGTTQELLEGCGADPSCIIYYRMASVPEITYWEEIVGKGVNGEILNLLLLFSAANCSAKFAKYLLARSADVNFRSSLKNTVRPGWTALPYAVEQGERETIMAILKHGADVLQEVVYWGQRTTISQLGRKRDPDLARMLAQIESEERAKRGVVYGALPESPAL